MAPAGRSVDRAVGRGRSGNNSFAALGASGALAASGAGEKQPAVPERRLSYSLLALKDPKRNPGAQPFASHGGVIFKEGDQIRLNLSSPQAGYLYVINEGPELTGGPPDFIVMFPNAGG